VHFIEKRKIHMFDGNPGSQIFRNGTRHLIHQPILNGSGMYQQESRQYKYQQRQYRVSQYF
jgi:hypothetical protein